MVLQHSTQQLEQLAVVRLERLRVGLHHLIQKQEADLFGSRSFFFFNSSTLTKKTILTKPIQVNKNLSIFCVAALCGFVEELQEGRPAVWGLVFDHNCTQLGQ